MIFINEQVMTRINNIRKINGHKNCHNKDARTYRLACNDRRRHSWSYLFGGRSKQNSKVYGSLGRRKVSQTRNLQTTLGNKMVLCSRSLYGLDSIRLVHAKKSSFIDRERIRRRRNLCLCRKKSNNRITL